jgi:RND family efflux transporter MFP subunit
MKKGAFFKTVRVIIVLFVSFVIMVMLVRLKPEAERQVPKQTGLLVEVKPVQAEPVNLYVEAYGTVRPREALRLVAEVRGQVVGIDPVFEEGSFVPRETVLIQIDPRTYQLEVNRSKVQVKQAAAEIKRLDQEEVNLKARLKIAKSDVALARNEYLRLKKLIDKKVISQSQLDKTEQIYLASQERLQALENQLALTKPSMEQLVAQRDMARVMLQEARLNLERTAIIAPFDGWALEKVIEKGQHVNAGQYLGKIYNAGELEIEVRIPVKDFKWLPADMDRNPSAYADIIFESGETKYAWKGHVARIKAQLDEKTRTLPLIIETDTTMSKADNDGNFRLRPGMFVYVRIEGRKIDSAYVLPRHLVYPGNVVYLVEKNQLKIRPVNIIRSYKDTVIIGEGLSDGELIITSPMSAATEGMRVRLKPDGS